MEFKDIKHDSASLLICSLRDQFFKFSHEKLTAFGINDSEYRYLLFLNRFGGVNQSELSRVMQVDKAHTTRVIQRLTANGLVRREQASVDSRSYHIYLTEQGNDVLKEIKNLFVQWDVLLKDSLKNEEYALLIKLLIQLEANVGVLPLAIDSSQDTAGDFGTG